MLSFTREIEALSDQNVNLCFQCSKCSSGCPLAYRMDLKPAQVVHCIRLGREEQVLNCNAIWFCAACETCTARCPQGVELAAVMNAARLLAGRKGIAPQVPEVARFFETSIENMRMFGRTSDLLLIAALRLKSRDLFSDLPLAFKLLERGKLNPLKLPSGAAHFRRIHQRVREIEMSDAKVPGEK
ncbi:MAG: 4Fe-4S dicluster domain-containing protein [Chloroflexota bacterium]|nr:4Fe-4S dicluster domain-containing protein [Chloroflexota bacterium]